MTAPATPIETTAEARSVPRAGWMVIARKEFADHILSARFFVLLLLLGVVAAVPLYLTADVIRSAASSASGGQAVFIALFWFTPQLPLLANETTLPSVAGFLGLVAPLLGLGFGFDAVNGERSQGTLPRLLSQPIHRDDVVNGKFAAGLTVIGLVVVAIIGLIGAFGILRLGIAPTAIELLRIIVWVAVTIVYVALWLAFGMLLSVVVRRAATSALIGFGVWFAVTFFGGLIIGIVGGFFAPLSGSDEQILRNNAVQETLSRLRPDILYAEASRALLSPQVTDVSTPATVGGYEQAAQRIPSLLSLDQSFILVWPQVVALVALTVACFAIAYVRFMRQEVRA
ncbi:MAG TPA: ABC transporter permease [Candidatus Limnocylindrales bacterium]|nr:ABC transporter permease [Candidatus Limnocylindrales bacterium]